jgi:endonuclease III
MIFKIMEISSSKEESWEFAKPFVILLKTLMTSETTEITTKKVTKNLNFWLLDASDYSILKEMVMK